MSIKTIVAKSVPYKRYQPPLYVTEKELPAIKDWKVGGKYQLILNVEQVGIQKKNMSEALSSYDSDMGAEKDEGLEARFKVLSVASPDDEASESDIQTILKKKAS